MTLTEFMLARIAEDEAATAAGIAATCVSRDESDNWAWVKRSRAECEAKRRIVELAPGAGDDRGVRLLYSLTLEALAMPYSDHPEYRDEWRVWASSWSE